MNKVVANQTKKIFEASLQEFSTKTFFVTGATGLIGRNFLYHLSKLLPEAKFIALVRDVEKSKHNSYLKAKNITLVDTFDITSQIDYALIGASTTKSKYFIEKSVETIEDNFEITRKTLAFLKQKNIKKAIFLSSMEVYGDIQKTYVNEDDLGHIDLYSERSSYSETKRLLELLCYSYYKQYSLPIINVRLGQVFGPGMELNDSRLMAYIFSQCVENKDIVLKTEGKTVMNSIYIIDLIRALIFLMLKGKGGELYNISNEDYSKTVKEICDFAVLNNLARTKTKLIFNIEEKNEYKPFTTVILSSEKLKNKGYEYKYNWKEAFDNTFLYFIEEKNEKS